MRYLLLLPFLAGCASSGAGMADVIGALAKDPATVCMTLVTVQGNVTLYRTAIPNGVVQCTQEGMAVQSVKRAMETAGD